jgi:hypothetical protein
MQTSEPHTLEIPCCQSCPFGQTREYKYGQPECIADLLMYHRSDSKLLGHMDSSGSWIYPKEPPNWCPLRQGPVLVGLKEEKPRED